MREAYISRLGDLLQWSEPELKNINGLTELLIKDIKTVLANRGLTLRMSPEITDTADPTKNPSLDPQIPQPPPPDLLPLNLSPAVKTRLKGNLINTTKELTNFTSEELVKINSLGRNYLFDIRVSLGKEGLELKDDGTFLNYPLEKLDLDEDMQNKIKELNITTVREFLPYVVRQKEDPIFWRMQYLVRDLSTKMITREQKLINTDHLSSPLTEFELSYKTHVFLQTNHILTIGELVQKEESYLIHQLKIDPKSFVEIKSLLARLGLSLGMKNLPEMVPD